MSVSFSEAMQLSSVDRTHTGNAMVHLLSTLYPKDLFPILLGEKSVYRRFAAASYFITLHRLVIKNPATGDDVCT